MLYKICRNHEKSTINKKLYGIFALTKLPFPLSHHVSIASRLMLFLANIFDKVSWSNLVCSISSEKDIHVLKNRLFFSLVIQADKVSLF